MRLRLESSMVLPHAGLGANSAPWPPALGTQITRLPAPNPSSPPRTGELAGVRRKTASVPRIPLHPFIQDGPVDPKN